MSALAPPAAPARESLVRLAAVGAGGAGLSGVYVATGWGVTCPFLAATGWLCPLCGGTRLGASLLHGDVAAAWAYNPLLLVAVMLIGIRAVGWLVELARRPRGAAGVRWVPWAVAKHWALILALVSVAYVLARNLF